jgi:hypothetical protein
LFKFERTNLILKRLCKNRRYPLASIVKNYLISECNFQHLIGDIKLVDKVAFGFQYSPCMLESEFFKAFESLHITFGRDKIPVMMYIPMASVIEIRGRTFEYHLTTTEANYLLFALGYLSDEDTLLSLLYYSYCENCLNVTPRKNVHVYFKEFLGRWRSVNDPPYRNLTEMAIANFQADRSTLIDGLPAVLR